MNSNQKPNEQKPAVVNPADKDKNDKHAAQNPKDAPEEKKADGKGCC